MNRKTRAANPEPSIRWFYLRVLFFRGFLVPLDFTRRHHSMMSHPHVSSRPISFALGLLSTSPADSISLSAYKLHPNTLLLPHIFIKILMPVLHFTSTSVTENSTFMQWADIKDLHNSISNQGQTLGQQNQLLA